MRQEPWLSAEDLDDRWVEVINYDGERLGWIERDQADKLHISTDIIETPERYLEDPWVRYHAQLLFERGMLNKGQDLNSVQVALLASQMIKTRERDETLRVRRFEEDMLVNNPDLFKAYQEKKKQEAEDDMGVSIEQRTPKNIEEFLATLAAFSEDDDSDSGKGQERAEGWLASLLSDDDLDQMSDE